MLATILIVEDEPSVREILTWRLKEDGYECDSAPNASLALKLLNGGKRYELMMSDIRMPGISGVELLKHVRDLDPDMAVIMVTAVNDVNIAIETLKLGAFDYITKPFNLDEVCISVERALEKRTLVQKNREYQMYLEEKVEEQTREIRVLYLDAIKSLVSALEAKDKYTEGHSRRVTLFAVEIARRMALPRDNIRKIYLAGLLHDIGKIGVRESVLNKPTQLDSEEFSHIHRHPSLSARILFPILRDSEVLGYIRHHHEHWDGSGRPDGLEKTEIPLGARILAVADAFDAITSDRPYRTARTVSFAVEEIVSHSGTQFDPEIISAFQRFVSESLEGIDYLRPVVDRIFPDLRSSTPSMDNIIERGVKK